VLAILTDFITNIVRLNQRYKTNIISFNDIAF
jgi:hypothetical protein